MKKRNCIGGMLAIAALLVQPTVVMAKSKKPAAAPTPPREIVNPYQPALECLRTQMSEEQKRTTIGIGYMLDRTGKDSYSQESAAGKFLGQASDDMLVTALYETGMDVVGNNPSYKQSLDWQLPKLLASGQSVSVMLPDVMIEGSFSSLDFGSSKVKEAYVFGVGGGTRAYHIRYTMDIRATAMPGGKWPAGKILTTLALQKDVVGRENKAGIATFFGGFGDSTFVEFNVNTQKREMLGYSQRYMISRAAFGIVSNLWNIRACDEILAHSDRLVSGDIQTITNIP